MKETEKERKERKVAEGEEGKEEEKGYDDYEEDGGVGVYVADQALDLGGLKQVRTVSVYVPITLFAISSLCLKYDHRFFCVCAYVYVCICESVNVCACLYVYVLVCH